MPVDPLRSRWLLAGAAVVDMLVGIPPLGNKVGEIGSAPPLPGNLANRVAGLAVFGNPSTKFGIPITSAGGGRSPARASTSATTATRSARGGDAIRSRTPITSRGPAPAQAAGFLAGLL